MPETFPWTPDLPIKETLGPWNVLISESEGGKEFRREKPAALSNREGFNLPFSLASVEDAEDMFEFFRRQVGPLTAFYVWIPGKHQLIKNRSFETGDGEGWDLYNASVVSEDSHGGSYSSKLVGAGSSLNGATIQSAYYPLVDTLELYRLSVWLNVPSYTSGYYSAQVDAFNSAKTLIQTISLFSHTAATSGWVKSAATYGPGGDYSFPANTVYLRVRQQGTVSPVFTAYMDDVSLVGPKRVLVRLNAKSLDREYFTVNYRKLSIPVIEVGE
jgi:hypothetical protein